MFLTKREWFIIIGAAIIIAVMFGYILINQKSQSVETMETTNHVIATPQETKSVAKLVTNLLVLSNAIKINPQSLGNLPWDRMGGNLTSQEIGAIAGTPVVDNLRGPRVNVSEWPNGVRFERIGFIVDQSYDVQDRKVYWASDVDVQRFNTFGVDSQDSYALEKVTEDLYVYRDSRGRICFFGYKLLSGGIQERIQSFANVPWQYLSGNISLEMVAEEFDFDLSSVDSYYNAERDADNQIISYPFSSLEAKKRGQLVAFRGSFEQGIFSYNGTIYRAQDIEIQAGDYPGGINPTGATPPFRLVTIRAGQPEEMRYVSLYCDKDENIVAATQTKNRFDSLASSGTSGGTSTFSSPSSISSPSNPGGNGGNTPAPSPPAPGPGRRPDS